MRTRPVRGFRDSRRQLPRHWATWILRVIPSRVTSMGLSRAAIAPQPPGQGICSARVAPVTRCIRARRSSAIRSRAGVASEISTNSCARTSRKYLSPGSVAERLLTAGNPPLKTRSRRAPSIDFGLEVLRIQWTSRRHPDATLSGLTFRTSHEAWPTDAPFSGCHASIMYCSTPHSAFLKPEALRSPIMAPR